MLLAGWILTFDYIENVVEQNGTFITSLAPEGGSWSAMEFTAGPETGFLRDISSVDGQHVYALWQWSDDAGDWLHEGSHLQLAVFDTKSGEWSGPVQLADPELGPIVSAHIVTLRDGRAAAVWLQEDLHVARFDRQAELVAPVVDVPTPSSKWGGDQNRVAIDMNASGDVALAIHIADEVEHTLAVASLPAEGPLQPELQTIVVDERSSTGAIWPFAAFDLAIDEQGEAVLTWTQRRSLDSERFDVWATHF
jgi:hypothetical protein